MLDNLNFFEIDQELKIFSKSSNNFFRKNKKIKKFYDKILARIKDFDTYGGYLFKGQKIFGTDYLTHHLTHFSFFCFYFLFKNYLQIIEKLENQNTQQIEQLFFKEYKSLIEKLKELITEKKKQLDELIKTEQIQIQNNSNLSTIKLNSKINMIKKLDNMKNLLEYIKYSEEILKELYRLSFLFSQDANIENLPKTDYNKIKQNINKKKKYAEESEYTKIYDLREKRLMTKEEYDLFINLIKRLEENLKKEELTFDEYDKYFSQLYSFYIKCKQIFIIYKDFERIKHNNFLKKRYSYDEEHNIFFKIRELMVYIAINLLEKFSITEIVARASKPDSNLTIILNVLHANHFRNNYQNMSKNKNRYLQNSVKKEKLMGLLSREFADL